MLLRLSPCSLERLSLGVGSWALGVDLIHLSAGPLTMLFDPANAFLRDVRLGDQEILRAVFGAVRNRNWDTVTADVGHVRVDERGDAFTVTFEAICCDGDVDFTWRGEIEGGADGSVSCVFDGRANAPFLKNRIGLCVLHPIRECAGRPCRVEHVDGQVTEGTFPQLISPHQPFRSIRSIAHMVVPGVRAIVTFGGDLFEMEDQRNWTDASYKTYSTPLHLPFPVRLDAGARVRQTVRLQLEGRPAPHAPRPTGPASVRVAVGPPVRRRRAPVGFGMSTVPGDEAQASLAALAPDHLRVDLALASGGWRDRLHETSRVARRTGATVHAALFLTDAGEQELEAVRAEVEAHRVPVGLWLIFHAAEKSTSRRWVDLAHRVLGSGTTLAAGTNAYFAELNRNRPSLGTPALPCFSITPQVHASDDLSLVETLEAQRSTVDTARSFCPWPVVVSPVTLRPRFNPNATDALRNAPPGADPRQTTAFGAVWTLGTLARLAAYPDVHSLTFYELTGPRGVMDEEGRLYPMGHVFAALAGWNGAAEAIPEAPLRADALVLDRPGGRRRVLLAGLDTRPSRVVLEHVSGAGTYRILTGGGFGSATPVRTDAGTLTLDVPPTGVVLVDLEPDGGGMAPGGAGPA
jgi:D-apionolactonase